MPTEFKVGQKYLWQGITIVLRHISDSAAALVQPDGSTKLFPAGLLELAPMPAANDLLKSAMQVPESDWHRATALADALRIALDLPSGKTQAVAEIAKRFDLSERRVYDFLKAFRENPTPWACLPIKPGPKKDSRTLSAERERIVSECIDTHYLRAERPSIVSVLEKIDIKCVAAGLPTPALNTLRDRIGKLELSERVKKREGRKRSNEVCKPAAGHVNVLAPLQRVEIDHTLCDVIVRADTPQREVLGRPWITLAIDCFTRMIVGFYITFDHPSSTSVALCLANAILPKEEFLRALGIPGEWPVYGYPKEIYVDNAMEFRAIALRRGCNEFGVTLCYRPPGEPQVGGAIERLIGTLMGRVHLLPGTTQSNVVKRGDYDSEARAQLTLPEFIRWLALEIISRYHTTTHRTLGKPPIVAWKEACAIKSPQTPGTPLEVLAAFLPADSRVLRRTGVDLHRINYWSPAFAPWVGHGKKVVVHHHPFDMERVYVRLPNGELAMANSKRSIAPNLTLTDHKLRDQADRQLGDTPELIEARHEGHRLKEEIVQAAIGLTKRASRSGTNRNGATTVVTNAVQLYRPTSSQCVAVLVND